MSSETLSEVDKLPSRQLAVMEAASELWPDGIPCGITRRDIEDRIANWLVEHGRSKASTSTIFVALSRYPRQTPKILRLTGFHRE
jgi:hypothetical protein